MRWRMRPETDSQPIVDWLAGQIHDPVTKLRFLQIAAAGSPDSRRNRLRFRRHLPLAILCLTTAVFLAKALAHIETPPPKVTMAAANPPSRPARSGSDPPPIWQVEKTADYEVYSNGLRIETRYEISTHPRHYAAFAVEDSGHAAGGQRSTPAGIVFHATESRQAPFEETQNRVLKHLGESTLEYVRRNRAYNFVIDRFGRIYRVVREEDAANHAGYSLWADDQWIYINLNESFLGVSFEAGAGENQEASAGPAQRRAASVLVEMLRSRYRILAANCVTHAQVSVNPANMRVGYHTDWASGFPFEAVGLPNNYEQPLWAVALFGFRCDEGFLKKTGPALRRVVESASALLLRAASEKGLRPEAYRKQLHREFREHLALARHTAASHPWSDSEPASAIK